MFKLAFVYSFMAFVICKDSSAKLALLSFMTLLLYTFFYGSSACFVWCELNASFHYKTNSLICIKIRRRGSATNCDLSREDSASLDTTNSYVFFQDNDVEYYQRVGKGQSCYRPYRPGSSSSSLYEPIRPISGSTFTSGN